jgi:hypothetical protein
VRTSSGRYLVIDFRFGFSECLEKGKLYFVSKQRILHSFLSTLNRLKTRANQQTSYHIASAKKTGPGNIIEIAKAEMDNAAPKDTGLDCVQESIEISENSVL